MNFYLRLLSLLSVLIIILGVVIKINHWPVDTNTVFNIGMLGLAVTFTGNFILKEKERKEKRNNWDDMPWN